MTWLLQFSFLVLLNFCCLSSDISGMLQPGSSWSLNNATSGLSMTVSVLIYPIYKIRYIFWAFIFSTADLWLCLLMQPVQNKSPTTYCIGNWKLDLCCIVRGDAVPSRSGGLPIAPFLVICPSWSYFYPTCSISTGNSLLLGTKPASQTSLLLSLLVNFTWSPAWETAF